MKRYRCIVEIKINAEFKGGFGLSKGVGSREGAIPPHTLRPWPESMDYHYDNNAGDPIARLSLRLFNNVGS